MPRESALLDLVSPDEVVRLTSELVRIPSHPEYPRQETEVALFIRDWLAREGLEVELHPTSGDTRPNVVARLKGRPGPATQGRTLMFNGQAVGNRPERGCIADRRGG